MGPMLQLLVVVCVVITRLTRMKTLCKMFKGIQFQLTAKTMKAFTEKKTKMECVYKRICVL